MKLSWNFAKCFSLLLTPAIASSLLGVSRSQAATLALANASLDFTNFSQSPSTTSTETITNAVTSARSGLVQAEAIAEANFIVAPPEASNVSLSEAFGEGIDYIGQAQSEAIVRGLFDVKANTSLSFDFNSNLNLLTSINDSLAENARAAGQISFALVDTVSNNILDFFSLTGNIVTPGNSSFIAIQNSDGTKLTNTPVTVSDFGRNEEFAATSVEGSLSRFFANETTVLLVEVKTTQVKVAAPEPSTIIALIICGGVVISICLSKRNPQYRELEV